MYSWKLDAIDEIPRLATCGNWLGSFFSAFDENLGSLRVRFLVYVVEKGVFSFFIGSLWFGELVEFDDGDGAESPGEDLWGRYDGWLWGWG